MPPDTFPIHEEPAQLFAPRSIGSTILELIEQHEALERDRPSFLDSLDVDDRGRLVTQRPYGSSSGRARRS